MTDVHDFPPGDRIAQKLAFVEELQQSGVSKRDTGAVMSSEMLTGGAEVLNTNDVTATFVTSHTPMRKQSGRVVRYHSNVIAAPPSCAGIHALAAINLRHSAGRIWIAVEGLPQPERRIFGTVPP